MLDYPATVRAKSPNDCLAIGDLLFAKYTCPLETEEAGIWTSMDYLVHVTSGRKTWLTSDGAWELTAGQTVFFKKGACTVRQDFTDDFCLLVCFVPDGFVRDVVREHAAELPARAETAGSRAPAIRIERTTPLDAFFHSMFAYFGGPARPAAPLLRVKLRELVVGLLAGPGNPDLAAYLHALARRAAPSVRDTMEANFRYNLALPEFAALCHRSLSSFKRDFQASFGEAPGRWLLRRRLELARALLVQPGASVTAAAFDSGFEDVSHFSRAFKAQYGRPPSAFLAADETPVLARAG